MIKVLLITNQYAELDGDSVLVSANTYDIIKRFQYIGQVRLLCCKNNTDKPSTAFDKKLNDITKKDIRYISENRVVCFPRERIIINEEVKKCDLVIGYNPSANGEYANKAALRNGKKYLSLVVACPWDEMWNHGWKGKLVAPYLYLRLKRTLSRSHYALYVTNTFLQKRYPCNGITCGASNVMIPPMDDQILEERLQHIKSIDCSKQINICTVAAVYVRYKGQQYVIKALGQLKKNGDSRIHYYLIGAGDQSFLRNLAKKNNVLDQVHFMGIIPHDRIFTELSGMDAYIQPSLQEGLPRSVVEAMSMGLLCIGAKTAAIPELLDKEWLTDKRSVIDIEKCLLNINSDSLLQQATRNFEEAKKYQDCVLSEKRNQFFDIIKQDIDGSK